MISESTFPIADMRRYCLQRPHAGSYSESTTIVHSFDEPILIPMSSYSDIAYYGINLNQSIILALIGYGKGSTKWETNINILGYLTGFYVGVFLPDKIGRVKQQFICSAIVSVLYAIWAGVANTASTGGLMTLFTISQLVLNAGPNVTTFLIPVEVFPTRVRGTAHGISSASGKCGAVLTAFAFGTITDKIGLRGTLGLFSGVMALCAAVTLLIPETKGKTLEDIEADVQFGAARQSETSTATNTPDLEPMDERENGKADAWSKKERAIAV